jgi:hypothetical protein
MDKFLSRIFPAPDIPEAPASGLYHRMLTGKDPEQPDRLHLRIDPSGEGVLIVNAAIVLHLNQTATEHIYWWLQEKSTDEAAGIIAARYRVSKQQARRDHDELRQQVLALSRTPDLDPVIFLNIDRMEPHEMQPAAPNRLDCALTYLIDEAGTYDPSARARVDRQLSTSEWKEILGKAWGAGIPHVTFTGGEATLFDGLIELIEHAEQQGQITGLLTNGIKLNDPNYLHTLLMSGIDHLLIAVNFNMPKTITGLQAALSTNVYTAAHITIVSDNSSQVKSRIDELKSFGVTSISLTAGMHDPGVQEALLLARDHIAHLDIDLVWDLPAPYSQRNPIDLELEEKRRGFGTASVYVEPDGDVLPGQGINEILGNMLRDEWETIWRNASRRS